VTIPLIRVEMDLSSPVGKAGKSTLMMRGFMSSTMSKRPAESGMLAGHTSLSPQDVFVYSLEASIVIVPAPHICSKSLTKVPVSISPSTSGTVKLDRMVLSSPLTHSLRCGVEPVEL
jgi:hypothetical protein